MFLNPIFRVIYYLCFYAVSMGLHNDLLKKCEDVTTKKGSAYWNYYKINYTRTEDLLCLKCKNQILIRIFDISSGHLIPDKKGRKDLKHSKMQCPNDLFENRLPHKDIHCLKISSTIQPYNEKFSYGSNKIIPVDLAKPVNSKVLQFLIKNNISDYWLPIRRENSITPFVVYHLPGKSWRYIINEKSIISINEPDKNSLKNAFSNENNYHKFTTKIKIILEKKYSDKQLTLVIYNQKYLFLNNKHDIGVQCYTYKVYGILKKLKIVIIWENEDQSHSILQIFFFSNYSSESWCENHIIFNFQLDTTRKLLVFKNVGQDFLIRWDVAFINKNTFNILNDISRKSAKLTPNEYFVYWIHISVNFKAKEVFTISNEIKKANQSVNNESKKKLNMITYIIKMLQALNKYNKNWTIRNAEFCFAKRAFSIGAAKANWILCLQNNGMPYTQICQGDLLRGAYWYKLTQPVFCKTSKNTTNILFDIYNSKLPLSQTKEVLKKVIEVISKNKNTLIDVDIHIISNIIRIHFNRLTLLSNQISKKNTDTVTWKNAICAVINVYNSLTNIKTEVLRKSAQLNSTNKLLESFEQTIDTLSILSLSNETISDGKQAGVVFNNDIIDYQDIGVSVKVSKNLLYFLINPIIANVSGIALFSRKLSGQLSQKSLINDSYRFLQSNHDTSDFFNEPNLQLGVYLPKNLLSRLKSFSGLSKSDYKSVPLIIVKVYSNDKLFQQNNKNKIISSRIISISIPRYSTNLPIPIPLIIRKTKGHNLTILDSCHYWNYGNWENDGIAMMKKIGANEDIVLCSLKHLSHFAYLVDHKRSSGGDSEKEFYDDIVDTITIAGFVIMFTGICCIFMKVLKVSL